MSESDAPQGGDPLEEWFAFSPEEPEDDDTSGLDPLGWTAIGIGIITLVAVVALWPTGESREQAELASIGFPTDFYGATVVEVNSAPCPGFESDICTDVQFELTEGPDAGFVYVQGFTETAITPEFSVGQGVVLSRLRPAGIVEETSTAPCTFEPETECTSLAIFIADDANGLRATWEALPGDGTERLLVGDPVVVDFVVEDDGTITLIGVARADPTLLYQYADNERSSTLFWLFVVFAVSVIALGGLRGVAALGGLAATVVILLVFVLPAILDGRSPLLVAIVGASAIAYLALYLSHGFTRMTTVALLGTLGALALTAVLSALVTSAASFSGFASEESTLLTIFEGIDVRGLLLAGIVLGAAGAIDDVTVTQASAVWQLKRARPEASARDLFRAPMFELSRTPAKRTAAPATIFSPARPWPSAGIATKT